MVTDEADAAGTDAAGQDDPFIALLALHWADHEQLRDGLVELAVELGKASYAHGQLIPCLPPGKRAAVVNALKLSMFDTEVRATFITAVQTCHTLLGKFPLWVKRPGIPEQLIQEQGFDALTDDQLAWVAIDPSCVDVVHYGLACGSGGADGVEFTPGRWYSDAILQYEASRPRLADDDTQESKP